MIQKRSARQPTLLLALAVLTACGQLSPFAELKPQTKTHTAHDLGTLGGRYSHAYGVSADGTVVVGYSGTLADAPRAFRWTEGGGMENLGTLGGPASYARAVSADGRTVAGESVTADGHTHAFIHRNGVMTDLGTLGGSASYVRGVNADGSVVVGESTDADGYTRAFVYKDGAMRDLGTLGGDSSVARDVSADGAVVVGFSADADGRTHAFSYRGGVMTDLGALGSTNSFAWGVSADGGVVVGYNEAFGDLQRGRAFIYDGVMRDLGTLGGLHSVAYDVSADGGTVVGFSVNTEGRMRAFAHQGGVMTDLGTLAGLATHTSYARAASADGRVVVGYSRTTDKRMHATLWRAAAKGPQTVRFTSLPPSGARVGGLYTPRAEASSGLGVTFSASGACTALSGAVRLVAVGTCTVRAEQTGNGLYEATAADQAFGVAPAPAAEGRYLIDFERTPEGRLVYRVDRSSGVTSLGGSAPKNATVPVVGKRRSGSLFLQAQRATAGRLYGSDRLTVTGSGTGPGTLTPHPQGGRLELTFTNYGPKGVTLTSLTLSNLTAPGAYLTLSHAGGGATRQNLGTTPAGASLVVAPDARRVTKLTVSAPSAFALDDVAFTDEAD